MTRAGLIWIALSLPLPALAQLLPIIDAHSQFDDDTPVAKVIQQAARAGVTQLILSARGGTAMEDVLDLAAKHPGCVIPSVRTKGRAYAANDPGYYRQLDEQLKAPQFRAMSEIIVAHAQKGKGAPEVNLALSAPQVTEAIARAIARGWPVVLHYEFRWYGRAYGPDAWASRMAELKSLLARRPEQPFALITWLSSMRRKPASCSPRIRISSFSPRMRTRSPDARAASPGPTCLRATTLPPIGARSCCAIRSVSCLLSTTSGPSTGRTSTRSRSSFGVGRSANCPRTLRMRSRTATPSGCGNSRRQKQAKAAWLSRLEAA